MHPHILIQQWQIPSVFRINGQKYNTSRQPVTCWMMVIVEINRITNRQKTIGSGSDFWLSAGFPTAFVWDKPAGRKSVEKPAGKVTNCLGKSPPPTHFPLDPLSLCQPLIHVHTLSVHTTPLCAVSDFTTPLGHTSHPPWPLPHLMCIPSLLPIQHQQFSCLLALDLQLPVGFSNEFASEKQAGS